MSASARRGVRERSRGVTRGTLQICLAGLLILGGCGSDDSGQSTSSPQATVTQTVQATAPSRTTSVKSQTKLCPTEQLKISVADGGAGLGHSGLILRFKNEGKRCTTRGYPGVNALMANGHVVDRARRSRSGYLGGAASGPRRISLRTGETASALLEGLSDSRSGGRCPAYRSLKITPPDETHSVLRSQHPRYSICDLQIHPLLPGRSGSER